MRHYLILPVSVAILIVWVAAAGFALIGNEYTPLEVVTPVMITLSGYVFGIQISRTNGRKNEPPE